MDAVDLSQAAEESLRQAAIRNVLDALPAGRTCRPNGRMCAGCGKPIPAKRLRALPGARLCIGCQREAEG